MDSEILLLHLRALLLVACVPVWALLWGYAALALLRGRWGLPGPPSLTLALALGFGLLSHFAWFVASVGAIAEWNLLRPGAAWGAFALSILLLRKRAREALRALRLRARLLGAPETRARRILQAIGVLVIAVLTVRHLLWALAPSFLYDVLEYHLPQVRSALASGTFASIDGNAYSLMPQGAHALYVLGRLFEGAGSECAPKLVHFFMGLATALLVNAMAREFRIGLWLRLLAVATFLAHPIVSKLIMDAYVDLATALYSAAALVCWLRACKRPNRLDPLLAAAFMGLALACKYPVLGVAVAPFLFILVPSLPAGAWPARLSALRPWVRVPIAVALAAAILGAAYSPWLVGALARDGSPFPPLTHRWIGREPADEERALRRFMAEAHRTESPATARYARTLVSRGSEAGLLLLLPALALLVSPHSDRRRRALAAFVLIGYALWNTAPHGADRFLAPLLAPLAVLGVLLVHDLGRWLPNLGVWAALPLALWTALLVEGLAWQTALEGRLSAGPRTALGLTTPEECLEALQGSLTGGFFNALNREIARRGEAKVLLLYEARAGALSPKAEVVCNTVFDISPLWKLLCDPNGDDPQWVLSRLIEEGVTHIAVNEIELARLLDTYPAPQARSDPRFVQTQRNRPAGAPIQPALLAFRRYYPPYWYATGAASIEATEARLDRFLDFVRTRHPPTWSTGFGAASIWFSCICG